jgi:hypothetical protein
MFPFLAPGSPAIRITTLCIYVVLPRRHDRAHQHCDDCLEKNSEDDDNCQCGNEPREKNCCCPTAARHFPIEFIPPGQEDCREKWRAVELVPHIPPPSVLFTEQGELERLERNREIYHCEIGDLELGPIGHEERNKPMRGVMDGGDVYGQLRFPRWMGKVKEAWILCGFEPVLTEEVRGGCCDGKAKRDGWKYGDGKRKSKYFVDSIDEDH